MGNNDHAKQQGPQGGPMDPAGQGKSAGKNTQSQGGISHEVAQRAREAHDPGAGLPGGPLGHAEPYAQSLDQGGGADPADGRAHRGLSGDDGGHLAGDSPAYPPTLQAGRAGDLGAQQDTRLHGMPQDPAERTTGGDKPNAGKPGSGAAGSPGGPARMAPGRLPGQDEDEGVMGGGRERNDSQRDPQV